MSTQDAIAARARALLEPVPGADAAGTNAAYDPRFDAVRTEIGKLDSVAGGAIDWAKVASGCHELLTSVTKDFLLASQQVVALLELEQWTGLAVGLAVVEGMYTTWWDAGFPPVARARARANALDWLVARLEIDLAARAASAEHAAAVDAARASWAAIAEQAKTRLGDLAPACSGVAGMLDRVRSGMPAGGGGGGGGGAVAAPVQPAVATSEAPASAPAASAPTVSDSAPVVAAAEPAPVQPGAPAAPADPLAEHIARAEAWLLPIPGDAPCGVEPRYENAYEAARVEISKQDSVTDNVVQWKQVHDNASSILRTKAKDVLMATYLAFASLKHAGLPAFTDGLCLLHGLLDRYWEGLWPERLRGRANAMAWFVDQLDRALGELKLEPKQRGEVLAMQKAVTRLAAVTRDRMGHEGPSFGTVTERIQRMLLAVPEEKRPEPPPPPPPTQTTATATPTSTSTPTTTEPAAAGVTAATAAAPASAEAVSGYLQETGRNLISAATALREASRQDATAYRLLRIGLYLHLAGPPPTQPGGKSQIPPLAPAKRTQLQTLEANGKWEALIDECEGALPTARFCFDLHRLSHRALERLGDSFVGARQAVVAELAAALSRMPSVVDLFARDGTPLSDGDTKTWINDVVLAGSGTGGSAANNEGGADDDAKVFAEVRGLLTGGKSGDAMRIAQAKIDASTSTRQRVQRRMSLATALLEAGQPMIARGMFAALERELREAGLFAWEPELASRCLEGFVRAIRAAAKAGARYEQADLVFERLCAVDPTAAGRLAT